MTGALVYVKSAPCFLARSLLSGTVLCWLTRHHGLPPFGNTHASLATRANDCSARLACSVLTCRLQPFRLCSREGFPSFMRLQLQHLCLSPVLQLPLPHIGIYEHVTGVNDPLDASFLISGFKLPSGPACTERAGNRD